MIEQLLDFDINEPVHRGILTNLRLFKQQFFDAEMYRLLDLKNQGQEIRIPSQEQMCGETFTRFLEQIQLELMDELIRVNEAFKTSGRTTECAVELISQKFPRIKKNRIVESLESVTPDDKLIEAILAECYAGEEYNLFQRQLTEEPVDFNNLVPRDQQNV